MREALEEEFEKELQMLTAEGLATNPLRLEYEEKVRGLQALGEKLRSQGLSESDTAKRLHDERRHLGEVYKDAAPPLFREYIYDKTALKYGDPLGPSYEQLRKRKTDAEIIESAARPIRNLADRLTVDGFRKWYQEQYEGILHLRHTLHRHPELSLSEAGTKERLMEYLRKHTGLSLHDMGSWFYAVKAAARKGTEEMGSGAIAFRADMDALPIPETIPLPYASENEGVSHKCGHDGHCAALCAFSQLLDKLETARTVYLVFQPAEEIGKGGSECADFLAEAGAHVDPHENVREVYAFHNLPGYPVGSIVVREGLSQPASEGLSIHFKGKESHASSPEEGRNPAFAIAEMIAYVKERAGAQKNAGTQESIDVYREAGIQGNGEEAGNAGTQRGTGVQGKVGAQGSDAVPGNKCALDHLCAQPLLLATIVGVRVGSGDFGISAGEGELDLTLRAEIEQDMKTLEGNLREMALRLAKRDGLEVSFEVHDYFPETRNDPDALMRVRRAANLNGFPLIEMQNLWRASEDFGYYTKKIQGAIFYIGVGEEHAPLHTVEYDFEDRILPVAARMFLTLAMRT